MKLSRKNLFAGPEGTVFSPSISEGGNDTDLENQHTDDEKSVKFDLNVNKTQNDLKQKSSHSDNTKLPKVNEENINPINTTNNMDTKNDELPDTNINDKDDKIDIKDNYDTIGAISKKMDESVITKIKSNVIDMDEDKSHKNPKSCCCIIL